MTKSILADKFVIRLPDNMRDEMAADAARLHISMNSFAVQAIEEKLDRDKRAEVAVAAIVAHSQTLDRCGMCSEPDPACVCEDVLQDACDSEGGAHD